MIEKIAKMMKSLEQENIVLGCILFLQNFEISEDCALKLGLNNRILKDTQDTGYIGYYILQNFSFNNMLIEKENKGILLWRGCSSDSNTPLYVYFVYDVELLKRSYAHVILALHQNIKI